MNKYCPVQKLKQQKKYQIHLENKYCRVKRIKYTCSTFFSDHLLYTESSKRFDWSQRFETNSVISRSPCPGTSYRGTRSPRAFVYFARKQARRRSCKQLCIRNRIPFRFKRVFISRESSSAPADSSSRSTVQFQVSPSAMP